MRVETAIGNQIAQLREARQMSLTQLGEALGRYLGRPWSRQAVHQAERGRRAFTAAELAALALALDTSVPALFLADAGQIELPRPCRPRTTGGSSCTPATTSRWTG
jgi:transcriptional regulator with XRE-family HTH domain